MPNPKNITIKIAKLKTIFFATVNPFILFIPSMCAVLPIEANNALFVPVSCKGQHTIFVNNS